MECYILVKFYFARTNSFQLFGGVSSIYDRMLTGSLNAIPTFLSAVEVDMTFSTQPQISQLICRWVR